MSIRCILILQPSPQIPHPDRERDFESGSPLPPFWEKEFRDKGKRAKLGYSQVRLPVGSPLGALTLAILTLVDWGKCQGGAGSEDGTIIHNFRNTN